MMTGAPRLASLTRRTMLDDAWTLDGDGWHWSYYERYEQHNTNNPAWLEMDMCAIGKYAEAEVTLPFADFASKAEAHATARCIVWLKARSVKLK
jgi:hypothetical protein